jgi:uncharacterized membrane protein YhaH (DUF805 family)
VHFLDLWRWTGRVDRKTYAAVGVLGFAVKLLVDGLLKRHFLPNENVFFFNYWAPLGIDVHLNRLSTYQVEYLAAMLLAAMPFIWLGLAMTTRRLRDAGWPVWLSALFFVPLINLVFLAALCLLPASRYEMKTEAAPWPRLRALDGIIPRSSAGSALMAILLASVMGLAFLLLGTLVLQRYGWGLFVALPFCMGLFSVLLYSYQQPRGFRESMGVALLPIAILGVASLLVAIEGLICILMAAPIAAGLAALGGMLGYTIQATHWMSRHSSSVMSVILLFLPAAFGAERVAQPEPAQFVVRTAIEVNGAPEQVWRQVIAFAEIPPPTDLLFRSGIAFPIRAEISGRGPGAIRQCMFSTGPFVEPIEVWDEPRLLRFGVTSNPPPLNELTPYGHIEPRHLQGYFTSDHGQFALTVLPGRRTRLEGTTWYRNAIWPAGYWRIWSDYIVHRIHLRVLEHIKKQVESERASAR